MGRLKDKTSDALVDVALQESFPASDSPAFMAAAAIIGAPRKAGPMTPAEARSKQPKSARRRGLAKPGCCAAVHPWSTQSGAPAVIGQGTA